MKWATFVIIAVIIVIVYLALDPSCKSDPYQAPAIASGSEYTKRLAEAEQYSLVPLQKYEAGEELTDQDIDDLKRGAALTKGLIGFRPEAITLYVGLTKSYLALKEFGLAHEWAQNGIGSIPTDTKEVRLKIVEAELHYISSQALESAANEIAIEAQKDPKQIEEKSGLYSKAEFEANYAVTLMQDKETAKATDNYNHVVATYMAQLASVKLQVTQQDFAGSNIKPEDLEKYKAANIKSADELVKQALKLDPENRRASQLLLLLKAATKS